MSSSARPVLWRIEAEIEYWGAGVAVFDPEKVINRLLTEFPGSSVDPIDYSDAEVQRVEQFLSNSDATEKTRESMLRSVKGKEKRNGPTYWCKFIWTTLASFAAGRAATVSVSKQAPHFLPRHENDFSASCAHSSLAQCG